MIATQSLKRFLAKIPIEFNYPLLVAVLVCLVPPAVFLLASGGAAPQARIPQGFVALVCDENTDEREIAALLARHHITDFVGESTVRVFINDFEGVSEFSLLEWQERLESFDPRNDGYAEKARALFVGGGKRRIFVPSAALSGFLGAPPDKKLMSALQNSGASIHIDAVKQPAARNWVIFILAALMLGFIAHKIFLINRDAFIFHYVCGFIPSVAVLADRGAAGFALAALSFAIFHLVRKPSLRFLTGLRYEKKRFACAFPLFPSTRRGRRIFTILLGEMGVELPKIALIAALWMLICAAGKIPFAAAFCFLLFFTISFLAMLRLESRCGKIAGHIPYKFMPILPEKNMRTAFPLLPVPLIGAALLQIALASLWGAPAQVSSSAPVFQDLPPAWEQLPPINEADYEAHFEFQKNFAQRNLNTGKTDEYLRYSLGDDGLIAQGGAVQAGKPGDAPPPPWDLAALCEFLRNGGVDVSSIAAQPVGASLEGGLLAVLLALCLYIPFIIQRHFSRHRNKLLFLVYQEGGQE
jgi:hypothetical protein